MLKELLKDKRVLTALASLAVVIAAYYGLELPQTELTQAVTSGDNGHVLSVLIGAVAGLLGGYGAGKVKAKNE